MVDKLTRPASQTLVQRLVATPFGTMRLIAREDGLVGAYMPEHAHMPAIAARDLSRPEMLHQEMQHQEVLRQAERELAEYFRGKRRAFTTPIAPHGTAFQRRVWAELARIPYGETCSYTDVARALGCPAAVRAVGVANGRNPLSIFIPCHRVIGKSGAMTGYAGGLLAKAFLLALERQSETA